MGCLYWVRRGQHLVYIIYYVLTSCHGISLLIFWQWVLEPLAGLSNASNRDAK